jgi:ubiquinone/menaquinone biosynthesis C-methylase UbiE
MDLKQVYQRNAARFDRERDKSMFERRWLERFQAMLPTGGRVLDLGCGSGRPVAEHLIMQGLAVTGMDFAPAMLALARARFPQARWIVGDMRQLDLGEEFDGVLGWNSFFHLGAEDQRAVLPRMARHLGPSGALMITVGPAAGEAWGKVAGEPVCHASLAQADYADILRAEGVEPVTFVAEDPDCNGHSVLLARRG